MNGEYSKVNFPLIRKIKRQIKDDIKNVEKYAQYLYREKYKSCSAACSNYDDFSYDNLFNREAELLALEYSASRLFKGIKDHWMIDEDCIIFNYYLENNIYGFLCKTKLSVDETNFNNIFYNIIQLYQSNNNYRNFYNFFIWVHSKEIENSILYKISLRVDEAGASSVVLSDGNDLKCVFNFPKDNRDIDALEKNNAQNNYEEGMDRTRYEHVRLILNLFFYMSAFPENVLDGPPNTVFNKKKGDQKTITISKEIADYLHENRDVSPHLRRGHFRYLGSDHYTKKRGQTIFVKSSFVKGTAKTIIENQSVSMA